LYWFRDLRGIIVALVVFSKTGKLCKNGFTTKSISHIIDMKLYPKLVEEIVNRFGGTNASVRMKLHLKVSLGIFRQQYLENVSQGLI
jgi:hypothetical protein